jgi:hypothetical protein
VLELGVEVANRVFRRIYADLEDAVECLQSNSQPYLESGEKT